MPDLNLRVRAAVFAASCVAALVACTVAPPAPPRPSAPAPEPARPAPAPTPEPSPPTAPVERAAEPAPAPPPYSAAVAARFPDPAVRYDTPGLHEGRTHFTTQQELQDLLRAIAAAPRTPGTPTMKLLSIGQSQRGVPLEALLFTRMESTDPAALVASARPTVLLIGQQHGDEPMPAEALIVIARELATGRLSPLLERINVIVLPRANPDGAAERKRLSASGVDINRDHLLLHTPEARAIAHLMRDFRPMVVVDSHEYTATERWLQKFGNVRRFDALAQYAMTANMHPFITRAAEEWFRLPLFESLRREQLSAEWYYTTTSDVSDKKVSMGGVQPDNGRNVSGLKNTVSFLLETRGAELGHLHAQRRAHTQVTAMRSLLASAASRAADLMKLRQFVEAEVRAQACEGQVVVEAAPTSGEYRLLMLDPVSGADKALVVDWDSALTLQPRKLRPRPCGYWLAAEASDAVARLRAMGVQVVQLAESTSLQGQAYRELSRTTGVRHDARGTIDDPGPTVLVQVELVSALLDLPAGSYYVPLTQPLANLVVAALEPDTQNGFVANRIIAGVEQLARVRVLPEAKLIAVP
jgi:hypothetical protein